MKILKKDLAVLNAVASDRVHHSITFVRVEHGRLVATDGRMLSIREIAQEDGEKPCQPFVLDPKALKTLAANGAFLDAGQNGTVKIKSATQIRDRKGRFTGQLQEVGWETTMKKPESGLYSYPQYEKVIPDESKAVAMCKFDPALLMKLMRTFDGVKTVEMRFIDAEKAVRFDGKTDDGRKVTGVIMPVVER